ncbi:hypothetical protein SAMD00019534_050130 [Acytostelium subglobosum LB1]|uniref:hypothetical protein n=1 Tax=Acytostelium subglobosum LB1 TaxID=1410327 RepID=UPI000644AD12|nr:hypothetical protein SAMD00019534_050130 [Acytostelium subglobosum LB1]GAM21838.1 hypothetical protein SAMD00019534_050130 [Acytostelium subglobosum LB1]|eukprot:XP_012754938.1 hypothetical protein SAMD00019534_050130 [Acytostelium subglobosum LB1]
MNQLVRTLSSRLYITSKSTGQCLFGSQTTSLYSRSFASKKATINNNDTQTETATNVAAATKTTTTTTTSGTVNTSSLIQSVLKEQKAKEIEEKGKPKTAIATLRNLPYSQWKMMPLFKALTGLSYREAIAQLTFANIGPANQLKGLMTSARYNAEFYKNLDPDRLVVSQIWTGRSYYQPRIEFKGRGRTGIRRKPFTHVTIELKEVERVAGEKKLGKFGKTHKTIENYNNPLIS